MNQVIIILLAVLKAFMLIGLGYLFSYYPLRNKYKKPDQIGTIVVDHSDGDTNIFLEIAKDDVEQWENGRDYLVRVEIRDYLSQE